MQNVFQQLFAWLLTGLQLFFLNVSYGPWSDASRPEQPPHSPSRDISGDSVLSPSVLYASEVQNIAQGYYTCAGRNGYTVENAGAKLTHELKSCGSRRATLLSPSGGVYLRDTMDVYYTAGGKTWYAAGSEKDGRVNAIRLGLYYLEAHVRDLNFPKASGGAFWADKTYHVYGDRLYQELALYASKPSEALQSFGLEIKIPVSSVAALELRDAAGIHTDTSACDPATVEYAAFDIRGAGVAGFIIPSDGSTGSVRVTVEKDFYVFRQTAAFTPGTGINKNDESGGYALNSVRFGNRIYTDATHSFAGIAAAADLERSPLTEITVRESNANARFIGYEALRGCYLFKMDGTDFNTAYQNPHLRYEAPMSFTSGGDRDIYVRVNGASGGLEAAAVLDGGGMLSPLPVEVCKNFQGDGGEPFYSVKDYQYGDSFFPLRLSGDETLDITLLNLYQNWGAFPLKQISSIEFHVSYYHLSTGVTESNCIAPYFVYDRDGWVLPDFRGRSGVMWAEQPQFNSVGRLHFVNYQRSLLNNIKSEYRGSRIDSAGLSYADITTFYRSDCGSYDYSLRHAEFPQTDENRTYYSLDLTFRRDITFKNARCDFELFSFDGRDVRFRQAGWLDESNQMATKKLNWTLLPRTEYTPLGNDHPYFGYFDMETSSNPYMGSSFALIVKDSRITVGGQAFESGFAFKNRYDGKLNFGALTLDAKCLAFKAGDRIQVDFILLPWGTGSETDDSNVRRVRLDSAVNPLTAAASVGSVTPDAWLPVIESNGGRAQFTLSGGANNSAVRVNGFESRDCPVLERRAADGEWETVQLAGQNGGDGYTVFYDPATGLYDFAFVLETPGGTAEYRCGASAEEN